MRDEQAAPPARAPRVVVIGAGASGSLTALHLARSARRREAALDVVLLDPSLHRARGTAFGTADPQHLLNVPAGGMSALPEDPGHFVAWRARQHPELMTEPGVFAPRVDWGRYLDETLTRTYAHNDLVTLRHLRVRATAVRRDDSGVVVSTDDGQIVVGDAVVLATGERPPGYAWAPEALQRSAFFVPNPWAPGAIDVVRRDAAGPADVLLVGTGLTMVDVVLSLAGPTQRPERRIKAVSRHGELPERHADELQLAAIPEIDDWGSSLAEYRTRARAHIARVEAATGDWRPAVDGLRTVVQPLWQRLSDDDRVEFLREDASAWGRMRHRMPPGSADVITALEASDTLARAAGEVVDAEPLTGGGLRVTLTDGSVHDVGWVVNCTGTSVVVRPGSDPLVDDLLTPRAGVALGQLSTAALGLRTDSGRLVDTAGTTDAPIWTLGSVRRGELFESTAIPEIRVQAAQLAAAVLEEIAPEPRRLADGRLVGGHHPIARPRDPLGLPLSTTAEAAAAYNAGLERLMRLQSGADEKLLEAVRLDPEFAVAHAALAMLGHEGGSAVDVRASLELARRAARMRADDRERSLVDVVGRRVEDVRNSGATALMNHIAQHPRDVLAVSAAVPTIAFSGVTDIQQEAWELVEGLAPAYGDHWWYISLLAFTRQDQSRFDDAGLLAESALECEPTSGHAVHAQTHVMYETGRHEAGRVWLDGWVSESGRAASHRAHFSWHAALHELAIGDTEAVRQRYYMQLAPPTVTGVRALIDSASLLWRWVVTTSGWDAAAGTSAFSGETAPPPVESVLDAAGAELVDRPQTAFVALHAALALAAAGDLPRLAALRAHCQGTSELSVRTTVTSVCEALLAAGEQRWGEAARVLTDVLPGLPRVGGSAAQREIVEETLLYCLVSDGQADRALALLDGRLDRRSSPLDQRRRTSLVSPSGAPLGV
ncbi:MAG TPA: FAD/NAD(P)-binding protein [Nocardioides sp.]|uniref:FAD/NAD(P)-binding protein n=1 Tax=Nocardioides sp. TaxID=35761 RepID=UPI002E3748D6|nr:FAD/NAD(P)-binding protein [Nocardioides sp.]HEX3931378.1 FAD/NAD(P)-binding protein [Nocardioides sp.]